MQTPRSAVGCVMVLVMLVCGSECGKFLFGSEGGATKVVSWNMAFQTYTGARVSLVHFASSFYGGNYLDWQLSIMRQAAANGMIPYVSLDPSPGYPNPTPSNVSMEVLLGQHDDFLNEYCDWLKAYLAGPDKVYNTDDDLRVHMRFAHEFNLQSFRIDPPRFILMWRYVWKFFVIKKGIDNLHVQWHWSIAAGQSTYDMDKAPFHIEDYYPGDAYVDWVGYDAYNWGDSNPDWGHWISSANLTHSYAISRVGSVSPNKPMCIAETGCATKGASVQLKNAWIKELFPYLHNTNKIQMLVMFNVDADGADWTYFGPVNGKNQGTENYTYAGDDYLGQTTFTAFDGPLLLSLNIVRYVYAPNPSNKRIVTDAEFFGHLTSPNMCPGTPPCSSRGACDLTGKCTCIEGFAGLDCSQTIAIKTCPGGSACSGHGGCIDGRCECLPNYIGEACQAFAEPGSLNVTIYHDSLSSGWTMDQSSTSPYDLSVSSPRFGNNGTSISVDLNNYGYFKLSGKSFYDDDFGSLNMYAYVSDLKHLSKLWVVVVATAGSWNESSNRLYLTNFTGGTCGDQFLGADKGMPNSAFAFKYPGAAMNGLLFRPSMTNALIYLDEIVIYSSHPVVIPPVPTTSTSATIGAATTTAKPTSTSATSLTSTPTSSVSSTSPSSSSTSSRPSSTSNTVGSTTAASAPSSISTATPVSSTSTSSPSPSPTSTTDGDKSSSVSLQISFVLTCISFWISLF